MRQFVADLLRHTFRPRTAPLPTPTSCDWVAIDFETANETRGSACAVGVAFFKDGEHIGGGASLIDPETHFNGYNTMIHGVDAALVADSPTFPEVWSQLGPLLEGQTVVAHNLSFDLGVLRSTAARYDINGVAFEGFCTYRMAKMTWPGLESYSLGWLALQLGLDEFDHHDAGDDSIAAGWLAGRVCEAIGCTLEEAAAEFRFVPARITADSYTGFRSLESAKPQSGLGDPDADPEHPLYGRTVCFTGGLASMPRRTAREYVCAAGADFKTTVSSKVDYLVIGDADFVAFADGWSTEKLTRARGLIAEGVPIEIIPEREFLVLLRQ
jgi:DNA polymerase-3 subunit epsilon